MAKKQGFKVNKIGIVVKIHQDEAAELALEVAQFLLDKGYRVVFADESKKLSEGISSTRPGSGSRSKVQTLPKEDLVESVDLVLVLGGDGTYLSVARLMEKRSVPILGINMGQLGFLTEIKKEEAFDALSRILDRGDYRISERVLLQVRVHRKNKLIHTGIVVNDAVISVGNIARILSLQVFVNDMEVNEIRADGVIISTPTGSTAYSLAAGGPVMEPTVPAFMITPICPHSLTLRPLVLPDDSRVKIELTDRPGNAVLTLDGQDMVDLKAGDVVETRKFDRHALQLLASPNRDYFSLLREKFSFGSLGSFNRGR